MMSLPTDSPAEKPGGPHRKPRADIYTVLLALALIAILAGILVLYFENESYEWDYDGAPIVSVNQPSTLALAPKLWTVDSSPYHRDALC